MLTVAAAALLLAACGAGPSTTETSETAVTESTPSPHRGEVIAEFSESIHADLPAFSFTLTGSKPSSDSESAQVRAIKVRRGADPNPVQRIDGLDAATPIERPGAFELLDMNFDGYRDMRLMESPPAGPNIPYRNWIFDPLTAEFRASPELDAITSPVFDPASKVIRSSWRDSASHYGEDTYRYIDGAPVLVRREERRYSAPGVYKLTISERTNGELRVTESREIRE